MHKLAPNSFLVTKPSELPEFRGAKHLFCDFETKNNTQGTLSNKHDGRSPFNGDEIAGVAIADDNSPAYYVPVNCREGRFKCIPNWERWLQTQFDNCEEWVNHAVIFDACFAHCAGIEPRIRLVDTLTLSKVHDTDRIGHGLKPLCRDWLDLPMEEEGVVERYLKDTKSRDWSSVPIDIMGEYACMDVIGNRKLYWYLVKHRPEQLAGIWETEILLASVLYDMEVQGLQIDRQQCKVERIKALRKMIKFSDEIEGLTNREWSSSSQCVHDILCNQFGLPILAYHPKTGAPTFDKNALPLYLNHPEFSEEVKQVVRAIENYRQASQFKSLYCDSFLELADKNDRIHPHYNAVVRTGRMSCSSPNIHQQNAESKILIHPRKGFGFISDDYSQIEYRLIVDLTDDKDAIKAYNDDPKTDFHTWVAEMLGVKRGPGKQLNFGMAYGEGRKKLVAQLTVNPDIMASGSDPAKLANLVYDKYHETFPGLKRTAYEAERACRRRGFVFNALGRRRHLPPGHTHKAFNSIIQGWAMDIIKEAIVRLSPRYNSKSKSLGLTLAANVHDEVLSMIPLEVLRDPKVHDFICDTLQSTSKPIKVPIFVGLGVSEETWAEAARSEIR